MWESFLTMILLLNEVLLDGNTVISTDFDKLGEQAANMVLKNDR